MAHWEEVSCRLFIPFHEDGIISQFEGYEKLVEFDWEGYRKKYGNLQRLDRILEAEDADPNDYKVSKQADTLMIFYLFSSEEIGHILDRLGCAFDPGMIPRNIRYYMRRTSHGSTLGWVAHAWVSHAPTGGGPGSWRSGRSTRISPTSRAARRRKASISAPWPERWT
ncbi:MAG: hypothetical protein ACOCYW_05180 [Roseicyclus sp.]